MLRLVLLVGAVQVAFAGYYSSHLSPASVTYINGPAHASLRAGPASYLAPTAYAAPAYAAPAYAGYAGYAAPTAYAAPAAYSTHHSTAYGAPATYAAYHHAPAAVGESMGRKFVKSFMRSMWIAGAQISRLLAVKAVPTVHHVPAVADVPIKTYEHTPAVIHKVLDVAKPAVQTRKFEVRIGERKRFSVILGLWLILETQIAYIKKKTYRKNNNNPTQCLI